MKRKMKKAIVALLLVTLMSTFLVACGKDGENGKGDIFVIGGMGPLTGDAASYGISVKQGADVAIKEINDAGGVEVGDKKYQLELKFEDDMAGIDTAVTAFNTLLDGKINVLLGGVTSGSSMAIKDMAKEENVLMLSPSGSELGITEHDNIFRLCFTDPYQGQAMAEFIIDDLGLTKAAVIYNNADTYSSGVMESFVENMELMGGEIVSKESFNQGDVDFKTQLTSIKDKSPEVIFVPAYYQDAAYITTQAAELGMDIPFLGSDGWDGVIANVVDTDVVEGAIFLSPFFAADEDEATQAFVNKYKEAYKVTPDQFAADGYDSVYVFVEAMKKAGTIDSGDLIAAMTEIEVKGLTGDVTFTAEGEPLKGSKFIEIKNGEYTLR